MTMDKFDAAYYKPYMSSIIRFMESHGVNLSPHPKIFVLHKDQGDDLLHCRTGYYSPEDSSIAIFENGRHPKDVLRSFAHELIHHNQHVDGNEMNFTTATLGEDSKLDVLEEDAYRRGNLLFRKWTEEMNKSKK